MPYDFNEAENIYRNGFKDGDFNEMMAFAKYSIHEIGNTVGRTEKEMIQKMKDGGFNIILQYDTMHKTCLWAKKPLSKETTVKITKLDIENIKNVQEQYQKILFSALFLAKKDNNHNYYNRDIYDAIKLSGVKFSEEETIKFLFFLKDWLPMILGRQSRKVLYSDIESELFMEISNKENPMKYFPRYCKNDDIIVIGKLKNGMCDNCYRVYKNEIVKKSTQKWRVNQKNTPLIMSKE